MPAAPAGVGALPREGESALPHVGEPALPHVGEPALPPQPMPPESRPLKLLGLGLTVGSGCAVAWILNNALSRWPLAGPEMVEVVLFAALAANGLAAGVLVLVAACGGARSLRHPGRRRAVGLQVLVANALLPGVLLVGLLDGGTVEAQLAASGWDLLLIPAAYVFAWLAWRLWRRSRRHEALAATEAMVQDGRPPVLYLRSFTDDGRVFREHGAPAWQSWSMQAVGMGSAEELIAGILDRVGPVIAIGKPGEALPELGAARLYVAHDAWQRRVLELMDRAALVVVRLGATPGVRWEIEQALARLPRQRLVFAIFESELAPPLVARLTELLGPGVGSALLEPVSGRFAGLAHALTLGLTVQRIGSLVHFDAGGRAHAVPIERLPSWRWMRTRQWALLRPYQGPHEIAWRAVFERLGLRWEDDARRRSRAVAVCLALAFGAFGGHWFYLGQRRRGWIYLATLPLMLAPLFLGLVDACRFLWADRAQFESRFIPRPDHGPATAGATRG